ncbi:MAG TPA: hypothetical protein VLX92_34680 [Kofleriaceae bacterium]|nr:hypothetical protein [Kofleriaceae bacterium]
MRWIAVAALVVCACGKSSSESGPTCEQVVDHMLDVMKAGRPGAAPIAQRDAAVAGCKQQSFPIEQRRCILAAHDVLALSKCRPSDHPAHVQLPPGHPDTLQPRSADPPQGSAGSAR